MGGNCSAPIPVIWKVDEPEPIFTRSLPMSSTVTSALGKARAMVASLLTGSVIRPGVETTAFTFTLTEMSMMVVVRVMHSPSASMSTFCRMGIVTRAPTMFVTQASPLKKWLRLTLNFMTPRGWTTGGHLGNHPLLTPGGLFLTILSY